MKRRDFLHATGSIALGTVAGKLWAADPARGRFLLVFLRGGYDCANLLIPYSSADYFAMRPRIAIARPDAQNAVGALALDADWALAPAVRDPLAPMYARGELAFIPFAGTEDLTRSHFETQDSIELGQPLGATRNYGSGFLARLAAQLTAPAPIAFTDALPLSFKGTVDIVVCDGFVGNVALKTSEGLATMISNFLKAEFSRNVLTKIAAIAAYSVLKALKNRVDHRRYNGAALLGLRGLVFKSHGSADTLAFGNALNRAYDAARNNLLDRVRVRIAHAAPLLAASAAQA